MTDPESPSTGTQPTAAACPFSGHTLPSDGRPLAPSPFFAELRAEGGAHPLRFADGHEGILVIDHELARSVLSDPRFSQRPQRFPLGSGKTVEPDLANPDARALASADLLSLDGSAHERLRKMVTGRFSVKAVRTHRETIERIVTEQLEHLLAQPTPADLTLHFAEPISARIHAHVLGIIPELVDDFVTTVVYGTDGHAKHEFGRRAIEARRQIPGDDVLSDLIASDLTDDEVLGLLMVLMVSGRDSVAYMIATSTVALFTHPDQLATLREKPELMQTAVEEFLRFGAMFVGLFPRTATEDLEVDGVEIAAGQTVSVSPVAANRDPQRFDDPDVLDVERDAFGHLGFGFGPHGCIGQQLARVEIRTAISALITSIPTLELIDADQLRIQPFQHEVPTYQVGKVLVSW